MPRRAPPSGASPGSTGGARDHDADHGERSATPCLPLPQWRAIERRAGSPLSCVASWPRLESMRFYGLSRDWSGHGACDGHWRHRVRSAALSSRVIGHFTASFGIDLRYLVSPRSPHFKGTGCGLIWLFEWVGIWHRLAASGALGVLYFNFYGCHFYACVGICFVWLLGGFCFCLLKYGGGRHLSRRTPPGPARPRGRPAARARAPGRGEPGSGSALHFKDRLELKKCCRYSTARRPHPLITHAVRHSVHLLPAGAAAMPSSVRPAARLSAFSSAASIFSVHMTGGSSGLTLECPATPGLVPRSWSMMGSTPR